MRLSMAAAAYHLGRVADAVSLLRQAARIGLAQLQALQAAADVGDGGSGAGGAATAVAARSTAAALEEPSKAAMEDVAAWVCEQLESAAARASTAESRLSQEELEKRLASASRFERLSAAERELL